MVPLTVLICLVTGLVSTSAHPALPSLNKRDGVALYFSPMTNSNLCMIWDNSKSDASGPASDPTLGFEKCAVNNGQQWNFNPLVDQSAEFDTVQDETCCLALYNETSVQGDCGDPNDRTIPQPHYSFQWKWTRDSRIQSTNTSTKSWAFGVTPTFSSLATGKAKYNKFSDTDKGFRIHGLGREDLCLFASALSGDLVQESAMVLAPCVASDSPMAKYHLFNVSLPTNHPTLTYMGSLTFAMKDKSNQQYCVDMGPGPVMGTQLLTWKCLGGPSQTFLLEDNSLKMPGTNWCAQVIGSGQLPGDEKDFNPMYNVVMNQCDPSNDAQVSFFQLIRMRIRALHLISFGIEIGD
ncbi:hypothetical protein M231_02832 [Tremella mesenterica]|uniref:Ricin B lectin domain-containing protein n=1 Tax=Tremella mesenterica TaxID=5217 RepID=A0A4Q1BPR9_TREME|nr:hypothetical protein M231_02832 [Tremella mesenterica]